MESIFEKDLYNTALENEAKFETAITRKRYQYGTLTLLNLVRGIDWNRFPDARMKHMGVNCKGRNLDR